MTWIYNDHLQFVPFYKNELGSDTRHSSHKYEGDFAHNNTVNRVQLFVRITLTWVATYDRITMWIHMVIHGNLHVIHAYSTRLQLVPFYKYSNIWNLSLRCDNDLLNKYFKGVLMFAN